MLIVNNVLDTLRINEDMTLRNDVPQILNAISAPRNLVQINLRVGGRLPCLQKFFPSLEIQHWSHEPGRKRLIRVVAKGLLTLTNPGDIQEELVEMGFPMKSVTQMLSQWKRDQKTGDIYIMAAHPNGGLPVRKELTVTLWNANGFAGKKAKLESFLAKHRVDVKLLGETHLRSAMRFPLAEFICHRSDQAGYVGRGGITVLVWRGLDHPFISLPRLQHMEAMAIQLVTSTSPVRLVSIYSPPYHRPLGFLDVLDFVVSRGIKRRLGLKYLAELDSDHKHVPVNLRHAVSFIDPPPPEKPNLKRTDWDRFMNVLKETSGPTPTFLTSKEIDHGAEFITSVIKGMLEASTPRHHPKRAPQAYFPDSILRQDRSVWCMKRNLMRVPAPRPPIVGRNGVANSDQEKNFAKRDNPSLESETTRCDQLVGTCWNLLSCSPSGSQRFYVQSQRPSSESPGTEHQHTPFDLVHPKQDSRAAFTSLKLQDCRACAMSSPPSLPSTWGSPARDRADQALQGGGSSAGPRMLELASHLRINLNGCQLEDASYSIESEDTMHYLLVISATCLLSAVQTPQGLYNVAAKVALSVTYTTFNGSDGLSFRVTLSVMYPTSNSSDYFGFR
uniref:Uncharacterized protein n=1 Tax=Timema douglasi TaxID=61478 RepID=A0A7R8VJY4_TIMDO|nr:unnamed protein product [Timema douglasi]